jgi:hypothetical protein
VGDKEDQASPIVKGQLSTSMVTGTEGTVSDTCSDILGYLLVSRNTYSRSTDHNSARDNPLSAKDQL